jgi:hypothetical protein
VTIDQARIGPGQLTVAVGSDVPDGALSATAASVGTGCFGLAIASSARPVLGTSVQLTTSGIPAGTPFGLTVLTLTQAEPPLDLAVHGMPGCFGYVQGGSNEFWNAPGTTAQLTLVVPNTANLIGLPVVAQSFAYSPPLTPLGFIASNGVAMVVGAQ